MKFKTENGQAAYKEVLDDLSERAIRMYDDVNRLRSDDTDPQVRFLMNLAIEQFQQEGLARAITSGTTVDVAWIGLQGGIAIASMKD